MTLDDLRLRARFWMPALVIAFGLVACSSDSSSPTRDGSPPDGSTDGAVGTTCGAGTPAGQACSNAPDNGPVITPTCTSGTMPSGTGGTIVAGTYHLTAQTYYNVPFCPTTALSGTLVIGGGCLQSSTDTPIVATISAILTIHGNVAQIDVQCLNAGVLMGMGNLDAPTRTFTATSTTLTMFTMNAQAGNINPDRVEVFARQ
jgi:hypothetical protein